MTTDQRAERERMRLLDREVWIAGFHGYEGCTHLRTGRGCPTLYLCSEKGDCVTDCEDVCIPSGCIGACGA